MIRNQITDQIRYLIPVSYTHLDVYKRQLIHLMLEMIHQNAVRDELSGSAKMKESILVRILLKEGLHPRPCKEFHTHRVNFTALIGWPDTLHRSD